MDNFLDFSLDHGALIALAQVILIDITLAGDNAVVIGMTAARVASGQRGKVIFWGLAAAVVMRIALAVAATRILAVLGLTLAGGILLLWVSWRLYRDIKESKEEKSGVEAMSDGRNGAAKGKQHFVSIGRAVLQITVADLSMSLDNVLAVAGVAMQHLWVLVIGLGLSVALMGVAAVFIARLLQRFPWISYAGLLMIVYVAGRMIWEGGGDVFKAMLH